MTFVIMGAVFLLLVVVFALYQASNDRKQQEARQDQCRIVEPVEIFNWIHHGVGTTLWGATIKDDPTSRIRTSPIELILNGGNVVETRSGSRYILR